MKNNFAEFFLLATSQIFFVARLDGNLYLDRRTHSFTQYPRDGENHSSC